MLSVQHTGVWSLNPRIQSAPRPPTNTKQAKKHAPVRAPTEREHVDRRARRAREAGHVAQQVVLQQLRHVGRVLARQLGQLAHDARPRDVLPGPARVRRGDGEPSCRVVPSAQVLSLTCDM